MRLNRNQLEGALTRLARSLLHPTGNDAEGSRTAAESIPAMQVTLKSGMNLLQFRDLTVRNMQHGG